MKYIVIIAAFFLISLNAYSQFSNQSYVYNGLARKYRIYVPAIYDGSKDVPLMLCLHGLGDNMTNFSMIGMNYIADTANFIAVFPQAIIDPNLNSSAWNSGAGYSGYYPNANIDDVGFLRSLMDTISAHYSINQKRIYACGFSMGGFMTNRLACEANDRIEAIASVAGTIGKGITCVPAKSISVCHFHGTADATVSYINGPYGMGAQSLVDFWVNNNNCNTTPIHTALPDSKNDGYTIDHYEYLGGDSATEVEFFKVNNANHIWLTPSNDISYSIEIWKFFNKHQAAATLKVKYLTDKIGDKFFEINPNPGTGIFNIKTKTFSPGNKIQLFNANGDLLLTDYLNTSTYKLDLSLFLDGIYFVKVYNSKTYNVERIILNK